MYMCGMKWARQNLEKEDLRRRQTGQGGWLCPLNNMYPRWLVTRVVSSKGHCREMVDKIDEWT